MGFPTKNPELFENSVATVIDMASILVAYNIGIANFNVQYGLAYAGLDAFMVVWMRKPISNFAKRLNPFRKARAAGEGPAQAGTGQGLAVSSQAVKMIDDVDELVPSGA